MSKLQSKRWNKVSVSKKWLETKYHVERRSSTEIGKLVGRGRGWVIRKLHEHDIPVTKPGYRRLIDLTGQTFGHRVVVKRLPNRYNTTCWQVRCACGRLSAVRLTELRAATSGSCGRCQVSPRWKGVGELSGHHLACIRNNAKYRKLRFTVTGRYLWKKFLRQKRRCAITGLLLTFPAPGSSNPCEKTASLDRINNNAGYVPGNVRWVHKTVNKLRGELTDAELMSWVELIAKGPLSHK